MTLNADFDALFRASDLVAHIEQALSEEKSRMQTQIDELTSAGWAGEAADQYARPDTQHAPRRPADRPLRTP